MNSKFLVVAHFLLCGCRNWHLIKQDNYDVHVISFWMPGLNGKQATWASKKYGHRVLPESLMEDLQVSNTKL